MPTKLGCSQNDVDGMIRHLSSLADKQLILSFAPKTLYYSALKRVGELFGGKNKVNHLVCAQIGLASKQCNFCRERKPSLSSDVTKANRNALHLP